ncbi:MAG: restriction endonuclease [Saprospiraceae bacterium]
MDFNQLDIRRFLIEAMPNRFSQLSPSDFESLIEYLFKVDGYEVEHVSRKTDPTTNLIARKEDAVLGIRVFRFPPEKIIGEHQVSEAIIARDFHESDQSWIITTSSFSNEAKILAQSTEIELWDWDALTAALNELFFEGNSYLDYGQEHPMEENNPEVDPVLKLKVKWEAQEGVGAKWYNLGLNINNPTVKNLYIHLDLPVLIDRQKNQVSAEKWADDEFVAGMIYAGASVKTNALFKTSRLGERPPGGRIIVTCHEREPRVTYHLNARLKGEACYIVTYMYTRQSPEYRLMCKFRDEVLSAFLIGRIFISLYYFISPGLIISAQRIKAIDFVIKRIAVCSIEVVKKYYV